MSKIILVIGGSCSGKTTFVKKTFFSDATKESIQNNLKPVRHCISGNKLFIGNYFIGKSCEGADTIGFTQAPAAAQLIKDNLDKYEVIIAEGERITKHSFFETMNELNVAGHPVEVYYLPVSIEDSIARKKASRMGELWRGGSEFSEGFLKMTITKARNFAEKSRGYGFLVTEVKTCAE